MNMPLRGEDISPTIASRVSQAFDLREIQDFFWRHWKGILSIAVAVVALTAFLLVIIPPRYTATAEVFLQPRKEKVFGSEQILAEFSLETSNIDSQVSVAGSTNLLRRVVEKQNLVNDPEFGVDEGLIAFLSEIFKAADDTSADSKDNEDIPPATLRAIRNLREALSVERVKRTYVLSISVTSKDRAKATRLSNAVANAFVEEQVEARYEVAKHASVWLADRLEELRQQVRKSEEEVAKFRREHSLVATSSEGKTTVSDQQLSELNAKLIVARSDVAEKQAKYEQAKKVVEAGGNIQGIPDVVRSDAITRLREQQAEVTRKEADLASRYGSRHPILINARAERRDIDRSISAEVQRILLNLKNDFEVANARERSLEESLNEATGKTGIDNNVGVRLRELERINTANKALFEDFLSRAKITQEQTSLEEREARVISPATKPIRPSSPKKGLWLAVASVLGAILGVGAGVAKDRLSPGYTTPQEIEDKLGIAVLAHVPILTETERKIEGKIEDPAIYLERKPLSRYAEAIRAVRVGIQIADVDNPPQIILITSSVAGEGKSTLSRSLSISASKAGQRVLLVDTDLRHPSTSTFFGLAKEKGLVELIAGETIFEDVAYHQDGLTIVPAGRKSQNPPDLLGSERVRRQVDEWRKHFDLIVLDSPPVEPVIDARVLSKLADKIVFVVRWQRTPRETVARNVEAFAGSKLLAGITLNLIDETKMPRYGANAYYSSYYHGKYYQN
jgi:succinoglycan biosynthesis transport protein ExoP